MSQPAKPRRHYLALSARTRRVKAAVAQHRALYGVISAAGLIAVTIGTRMVTKVIGFSKLRKILLFASLSQRLVGKSKTKKVRVVQAP